MEDRGNVQRGTVYPWPTTSTHRSKNARIKVLYQSRQNYDIDGVSQSNERPNASHLHQNGFFRDIPFILVQYHVAVIDEETNELWDCNMRCRNRKLLLDGDSFSIEIEVEPNGLVTFHSLDWQGQPLPQFVGNVMCHLPVESDDPVNYKINIKLFQCMDDFAEKTELDCKTYLILSHETGHDVYDYQEGRSISEIEKPHKKIPMTGILAEPKGRNIVMHFQNLGDNGLYTQFHNDKQKLFGNINNQKKFQDLAMAVLLEECIILFAQNKTFKCEATCKDVCRRIKEINSANAPFLMAKAHYVMSAVYRQAGNFEKAKEHMEISTELLEPVITCEDTAVNQYNWAAYYSEKSTKAPLTKKEKKEADRNFDHAVLLWKHQTENDSQRCLMRTLNRRINYHLKTSRQKFPDPSTPGNNIDLSQAASAIDDVKKNLLPFCASRLKVTFHIGEADFYIRRATHTEVMYSLNDRRLDLVRAVSILEDAKTIGRKIKLDKEIEGIEHRLTKITEIQLDDVVALTLALAQFKKPVETTTNRIEDLLEPLNK